MRNTYRLHGEQFENDAVDGNVFGVQAVEQLPVAGDTVDLKLFNYISTATPLAERDEIISNRKLCPVWAHALTVTLDTATVVESVTDEIIEPRESKRKHFRATQFIGSAVVGEHMTSVSGIVGRTFTGIAELPDLEFDQVDLPGLLRVTGELPYSSDRLTVITNDMKPHQVKKAEKLRTAQMSMFVGGIDSVMQALRSTIPGGDGLVSTRPLIPTFEGWRSW